jgi:Mg2+ and Co2+ transporter CorA
MLSIAHDRRLEKEVEQSASLLHLDYGKTLEKQIMAYDPFYAIHELLMSFAYSEAQFLNVIESKINEDIAKEFSADHNISPANMIFFQGLLDNHAETLRKNVATIKYCQESGWPKPSDEKLAKKTAAQAQALLQDYKGLLKRAETLSNTCKTRLQILMSRAGIVESNKAIEQAKVVTKLTRLAFVFIPLSFVSSFFGMNLTPFIEPPGLSLWLFFAVSAPVVVLLLVSMNFNLEQVVTLVKPRGEHSRAEAAYKLRDFT